MTSKMNFCFGLFLASLTLTIIFSGLVIAEVSSHGPPIESEGYKISRSKVEREISVGYLFEDFIIIENLRDFESKVYVEVSDELKDVVEFGSESFILPQKNNTWISFLIKGKRIGTYQGTIFLKGDVIQNIPINISVVDLPLNPSLIVDVIPLKDSFLINRFIELQLKVNKLRQEETSNVSFKYTLKKGNYSEVISSELIDIKNSFQEDRNINIPAGIDKGVYTLETTVEYGSKVIITEHSFIITEPFYSIKLFGLIPVWSVILFSVLVLTFLVSFILIRKSIASRKKYRMKLDAKKIPKKDPSFFLLGRVAETKIPAYLEPNRLMTHTIVAGATGGGKSIAAQVIIEEALMKNIAVVVFDPTAQWSGMLRKCTDKKMLSYYPAFGLKENDAKAFPGSIKQVKNAREVIDINKYVHPGNIQILTLNKLDPSEIDLFIASIIRQIFKSDPKESPDLKVILVFDEVHRLLSKFGGSGEGFLQIERACREFRKWGLGIMLVSQVLSDFVGEIKANISTEVQLRTRDEGDLKRIQTKYGEEFLKSLVKASVGVGMFVNPAYNSASPYFINFRPILHNTRRLTDEELDQYNKYNDLIEDIDFQIEQLEKEKVDTFDLKMELKLVKDKVMTGNFSIVDIYLEGLTPRIESEWKKMGKKPKKREIKLVEQDEIKKSVEEAKKEREKWESEEKKKSKTKEEKNEKVEEKSDDQSLKEKIVKALTFDNGIMVSSLKELEEVIRNLDDEIFSTHINDQKNDIADWVSSQISTDLGKRLKPIRDKNIMFKEINDFGKPKEKTAKQDTKK